MGLYGAYAAAQTTGAAATLPTTLYTWVDMAWTVSLKLHLPPPEQRGAVLPMPLLTRSNITWQSRLAYTIAACQPSLTGR